MNDGLIVGCAFGIVAVCIVCPPLAWPIAAVVATVFAFAGDRHG